MKIVFLDIDGVLNTPYTKEIHRGFRGVDARLVERYNRWFDNHLDDLQTILTSTWRLRPDDRQELTRAGLFWIDQTPDLSSMGQYRGHEIKQWMNMNGIPERYVILDDEEVKYFLPNQRPFLVRTSPYEGLRTKNLTRMEAILYGSGNRIEEPARLV